MHNEKYNYASCYDRSTVGSNQIQDTLTVHTVCDIPGGSQRHTQSPPSDGGRRRAIRIAAVAQRTAEVAHVVPRLPSAPKTPTGRHGYERKPMNVSKHLT